MSLQKLGERPVMTLSPEQSILGACQLLRNKHIGCLVVVEDGQLRGMLTDRDIALNVAGTSRDPQQTKVREVMTANPVSIPVNRKLSDLTALMHSRHVRRMPIVDAHEKVIGLVTLDDLLVFLSNEMVDMRETVSAALFSQPAPVEHREAALPLDWITSYL